MKKWLPQILQGALLVVLSAVFYTLHYVLFHDAHHIFVYLVGDIAFVFIEVLLVSMIIHRLLGEHERHAQLEKINMIIGVFYSEVGIHLLKILSDHDPKIEKLQKAACAPDQSSAQKLNRIFKMLKQHDYELDASEIDWDATQEFLLSKKDFLVRLLENSSLHEHESFTDVLRSVFHLMEELAVREKVQDLPDADLIHLAGDVKRAYGQLALQWLSYMSGLEKNYPHLFSFAVRMNPFDRNISPVIRKSA